MIDWTKPIRWVDDKEQATVLLICGDCAWVVAPCEDRAYLFGPDGRGPKTVSVENIPEPTPPIVSWINQYPDTERHDSCAVVHELREHAIRSRRNDWHALIRLTYYQDEKRAEVEVVETREEK
jgi:hypothetical protein